MKSQSTELHARLIGHTHNATSRKSEQEFWDDLVFSFLRECPESPEAKRIEKLLSLLTSAQHHLDEIHRLLGNAGAEKSVPKFLENHRKLEQAKRAYYGAVRDLDKAFKRYRWRSFITGDLEGIRRKLGYGLQSANPDVVREYATADLLLEKLKEPGAIGRFRNCAECRQWFYAATSHQQFCTDACRRRNTARNPDFREKRRVYMRERYRPLQKELDKSSRASAKETRPNSAKGKGNVHLQTR